MSHAVIIVVTSVLTTIAYRLVVDLAIPWFKRRNVEAKAVEQWAVVQELLPFGYRIDKVCESQKQAEREASVSQYLTVHPLAWVRSENERLSQPTDFTSELHDWSARREES